MKNLKLMLCFFRKNPFLLLFVLLEMTLSMALFADQLGELQYRHYALDLYQDSELVGCDHFTAHIVPGLTDSPDSAMAAIFEAAQNTDGVEAIGINRTFGGINAADLNLERKLQRRYTVSLLTPSVFNSLPLELSDGTWQPEEKLSQTVVDVVACGSLVQCIGLLYCRSHPDE